MRPPVLVATLLAGMLCGFGLALSTMVRPESVLAFLRLQDFGLLFVLGGAVAVTLVVYQLVPHILTRPVLRVAFDKHPSDLNARTIGGAAIFGIGWGICGVCPGPALAALGTGDLALAIAIVAIFAGAYVQGRWFG
jgi:uncharacterized membrane protein YedE/YeeE